jgi:hypothetical protein
MRRTLVLTFAALVLLATPWAPARASGFSGFDFHCGSAPFSPPAPCLYYFPASYTYYWPPPPAVVLVPVQPVPFTVPTGIASPTPSEKASPPARPMPTPLPRLPAPTPVPE